uniref:G-protein coupled receptors family 2 profile 2 domain-containing protein n=1 Tax=Biomphalaria glabrata TaxID=6526 RepID=A0A2C9KIY5_BIOGL
MTINEIAIPPKVNITLDFKVTQIYITDSEDLVMVEINDNGELDVCIDLIDRKLKEQRSEFKSTNKECEAILCWVEYILTLVCFSISIVCLLVTLLTYLLFSVLRTVAGRNNMFLSGSLLMAQVSLLASLHISQPSILCQVIGVVTHFLWLWMFSWSFMCSYHMYHVFTANTPTYSAGSTTHGLRKSVCGSFVLPATAVIAVIVYSYWATQGRQVGYGNVMCYLDLPLFR